MKAEVPRDIRYSCTHPSPTVPGEHTSSPPHGQSRRIVLPTRHSQTPRALPRTSQPPRVYPPGSGTVAPPLADASASQMIGTPRKLHPLRIDLRPTGTRETFS